MSSRIERDLRFLKYYAVGTTVMLGVLTLAAFTRNAPPPIAQAQAQRARFDEIDVGRINVVEPDGKYRMVISNRPRSIGPIYKGKPFGYPGGARPGIIFFNDEGTEDGGLTFSGQRGPDGKYVASHHLSFDQYDQDQVIVLDYNDDNGRRRMGLAFSDRADVSIFDLVAQRDSLRKLPDGPAKTDALQKLMGPRNGVPLAAQRVFVGRDANRAAVLNLSAPDGKPRLRLMVDSLGTPKIEFLDETGRVTSQYPAAAR
jgi:hypothetical protein